MPYAHDFIGGGPGADLVFRRQRAVADDQAVIAGGGEGVGHAGVKCSAIMVNLVGLSVHEFGGALDDGAGGEADALVAQADAQHGEQWAEVADDVIGDAPLARRAGAGGDDDVRGPEIRDLIDRDLVIAEDLHLQPGRNFAKFLHQVVGERIVVIDQNEHG